MDEKDRSKEEYQLRLESESEVIRILTVHKAKGLEYPITFIPYLAFSQIEKRNFYLSCCLRWPQGRPARICQREALLWEDWKNGGKVPVFFM